MINSSDFHRRRNASIVEKFFWHINQYQLYEENSLVDQLLYEIATQPIEEIGKM